MKKTIILLLIVATGVVALVFLSRNNRGTETKVQTAIVGLNAPELMLSDPSGKTYSLSDLKDSVVLVNFWATWCQPCRDEMPSLQTLYNQFKEKKGFRMVTVLYRDDYQRAMAYMKENNYEVPVLLDSSGNTARSYGVTGVPETYILDKKGILREKMIGPFDWASPQALSLISELLKN
jgi:DsbE subfamily thiol:disulfide oxidoreductase